MTPTLVNTHCDKLSCEMAASLQMALKWNVVATDATASPPGTPISSLSLSATQAPESNVPLVASSPDLAAGRHVCDPADRLYLYVASHLDAYNTYLDLYRGLRFSKSVLANVLACVVATQEPPLEWLSHNQAHGGNSQPYNNAGRLVSHHPTRHTHNYQNVPSISRVVPARGRKFPARSFSRAFVIPL